jgi:hypothetical protein
MRAARLWGQGISSLGAQPGKSILMALGITIGIAALTVIFCISHGGRQEVEKKVRRFGARAVLVVVGHGVQSNTLGGSQVHLEPDDLAAVESQSTRGGSGLGLCRKGGASRLKPGAIKPLL